MIQKFIKVSADAVLDRYSVAVQSADAVRIAQGKPHIFCGVLMADGCYYMPDAWVPCDDDQLDEIVAGIGNYATVFAAHAAL